MADAPQQVLNFPADDEMPRVFPEFIDGVLAAERLRAVSWKEVGMFMYYRVLSLRKVQRQDGSGEAIILSLQSRAGRVFDAWATSLIAKDVEVRLIDAENSGKFLFIKSLGKKISASTGREYWNFVYLTQ